MKNILSTVISIFAVLQLSSCLALQENYEYVPTNADPHIGMTAWEFIGERQDIFSSLKEAIEYVSETWPEMQELYSSADHMYTYMFMNNSAFSNLMSSNGVSAIRDFDPEQLRDILLYHIVDGYYHSLDASGGLSFDNLYVVTLYRSQDVSMVLKLDNRNGRGSYGRLVVNDNTGYPAVTSNLVATNGIINVFERPLITSI